MLQIQVENGQQKLRLTHRVGRLQFGRIVRGGSDWVTLIDDYVSREQLEIEERDGRLHVTNLSKRVPVLLSTGRTVGPGETGSEPLPLAMQVGATTVRVDVDSSPTGATMMTITAPVRPKTPKPRNPLVEISGIPDEATNWFETILSVQRAAPGTPEYYQQTARAVVDLVGLDYGIVLLLEQGAWKRVATYAEDSHVRTAYSQTILNRVQTEKRTFYERPEMDASASLIDISAVVASPILDGDTDEVIGVLYGARTSRVSGLNVEIRQVEAQLLQILAAAVGAGLARIGVEEEVRKRHQQFEQFFTPELAKALDRDPDLLNGREQIISVLFADIRNFSQISEMMGAVESVKLVEDVMEHLTARIRHFNGVLVTYLGDGLLAMWNAPVEQPEHASLACQAGLALIGELPELNKKWGERIGRPLKLGVGVNTGPAVVGNTGSRYKMHYGPLGHTVNLASRVESATKQLGVPMLITGGTQTHLEGNFASRRLCRVRVSGIAGPVNLYELHSAPAPQAWQERRDAYEAALVEYEAGRWANAGRLLQPLLDPQATEYDIPSLMLLGRCLECLKQPPAQFDPVWDIQGK